MQTFLEIMIAVGGAVYIVAQWRSGKVAAAKATIDLLTERGNAFEQALKEEKELNKKNHLESQAASQKNHDEIIRLQEQLIHSKEENSKLLNILQGRDPAMLEFNKMVSNYTITGLEYMKVTSENIKQINTFMEKAVPILERLDGKK